MKQGIMASLRQRSTEWRRLRLGEVSASRFGDVLARPSASGVFSITGTRGRYCIARGVEIVSGEFARKADATERRAELVAEWQATHWSQTAESYLDEKLAEMIHCTPGDVWRSDATDWGTAQEPNAFKAAVPVIEALFNAELCLPVDDFAYIHHATEPHIGCSPDGIIGDQGVCEIKCPYNPSKWMRAKRKGLTLPPEYVPQVQGQLWVTDRQWCAFCYFDPRVTASGIHPLLWMTVERDNEYIDKVLAPKVTAFRDYLYLEYDRLVEKEVF